MPFLRSILFASVEHRGDSQPLPVPPKFINSDLYQSGDLSLLPRILTYDGKKFDTKLPPGIQVPGPDFPGAISGAWIFDIVTVRIFARVDYRLDLTKPGGDVYTVANTVVTLTDANNPSTRVTIPQGLTPTSFPTLQQSDPQWKRDSANNPGIDGQYGYNWRMKFEVYNPPSNYFIDAILTTNQGSTITMTWKFQPFPV